MLVSQATNFFAVNYLTHYSERRNSSNALAWVHLSATASGLIRPKISNETVPLAYRLLQSAVACSSDHSAVSFAMPSRLCCDGNLFSRNDAPK